VVAVDEPRLDDRVVPVGVVAVAVGDPGAPGR
jgi:hypothetical protein